MMSSRVLAAGAIVWRRNDSDELEVALIHRPKYDDWSFPKGKLEVNEIAIACAFREVMEETGIDIAHPDCELSDWALENVYEIYPAWRFRYAPHVSHNKERVFGLKLPQKIPVQLSPNEHTEYQWLSWQAAADTCFSPSNAEAILMLPRCLQGLR